MGKTIISFNNVVKRFDDDETVLKKVSFDIEEGRFYTLLGPSGCGKTTILRIIAGFSDATEGDVYFDGQRINDVPANQRQVNTVFQDYALFPHMNVFENVAFGLRIKKLPKDEVNKKVLEALRLVQLPGYENREISEMSGGQRQRVAIARAIVNEPKVLLLDEPLSALDLKLRTDMQYELRELQQRLGITFIFVTHDQEEALAMSDEIFVMNKGKIVQSGTPVDIYDEPINHFVADFVGESNIVTGTMIEDNLVEFVGKQFECVDGGMRPNEAVEIVIRPEDLNLTTAEKGKLVVEVDTQLFRGVHYEIICYDEQGNEWMVHSTRKATEGSKIGLSFEPEDIHVMRFNESEEDFEPEEHQETLSSDTPASGTMIIRRRHLNIKSHAEPFDSVDTPSVPSESLPSAVVELPKSTLSVDSDEFATDEAAGVPVTPASLGSGAEASVSAQAPSNATSDSAEESAGDTVPVSPTLPPENTETPALGIPSGEAAPTPSGMAEPSSQHVSLPSTVHTPLPGIAAESPSRRSAVDDDDTSSLESALDDLDIPTPPPLS